MSNPAAVSPQSAAPELSWGSMVRTNRVVVGTIVGIAIGLLFLSQTRDMLSGMADRWNWTVGFQFALFFVAFNGWYWSRAVLSARFDVHDDNNSRKDLEKRQSTPTVETKAFNFFPRLVFVAVGLVGLLAAVRSATQEQAIIIGAWLIPGFLVLTWRLWIQAELGLGDLTAANRPGWTTPSSPPTFWRGLPWTVKSVVAYAPFGRVFSYALLTIAVLCFIAGAILSLWPGLSWRMEPTWWAGYYFPGPAAVLICLGLAIGPLTMLTYWFDLIHVDGKFLGINWYLRRVPLFTIMIAVLVFVPALMELHRVRIVAAGDRAPGDRPTLAEAFTWWAANCAPQSGTVRPIIVAISGGASAAGLWGARMLEEVDAITAQAESGSIFAISSVSGGSLGAAAYLATIGGSDREPACAADPATRDERRTAVRKALGSDFLGPFMASALFGDVPRAFVGPFFFWSADLRDGDRANGLEGAFEKRWSDSVDGKVPAVEFSEGFLTLHRHSDERGGPIWIANGTDAQRGNRLLTVPFKPTCLPDADPPCEWPFNGAGDVLHILNADVPISTAVHNTARFPFLSPSGALVPAGAGPWPTRAHIIDGGYFDNDGLLTAEELSDWLLSDGRQLLGNREIDPIIVEVTAAFAARKKTKIVRCQPNERDDPTDGSGEWSILHFFAPVSGLNAVRGGHADAEFRRARTGRCESDLDSFFHFYLFDSDELRVPLNWTLSDGVGAYVWDEAVCGPDNRDELDKLKRRLGSTAETCEENRNVAGLTAKLP